MFDSQSKQMSVTVENQTQTTDAVIASWRREVSDESQRTFVVQRAMNAVVFNCLEPDLAAAIASWRRRWIDKQLKGAIQGKIRYFWILCSVVESCLCLPLVER